eukprot:comp7338_c0_seq1/m.3038 comp7338_c0_seq1/g.3038  ORF comp7338_c0_seq1/g.3038 comp7338_c0_seq1/m.3038 type:complete len:386 (-) comp7338_c0_seq1:163-1320(-)
MATVEKRSVHVLRQNPTYEREDASIAQTFSWGLKHSVLEFSHTDIPKIMIPDQYKAYYKVTAENHLCRGNTKYSFKEFCPVVFRDLRNRFQIVDDEYVNSLRPQSVEQIDGQDVGWGVGTVFYRSNDRRFLVKTIDKEEAKIFKKVFWNGYRDHMVEFDQETLMPKYTGIYKVAYQGKPAVYLLCRVLGAAKMEPTERYVLKPMGMASGREIEGVEPTEDNSAPPQHRFHISDEAKVKFLKMLHNDVEFVRGAKLLTCSLLVKVYSGRIDPPDYNGAWFVHSVSKDETYAFILLPFGITGSGLLSRKDSGPKFLIRRESATSKVEKERREEEEKRRKEEKRREKAARSSEGLKVRGENKGEGPSSSSTDGLSEDPFITYVKTLLA